MSIANLAMSLAPCGAEDDGTHGNQSVPAMLRSIRELLHVHTEAVTQLRASLSTEELSSVMGSPKPGKLPESSRVKLLDGFPSIVTLLGNLTDEGDEGKKIAEAIRKDLHSLIIKAVELSNERRNAKAIPKLFEKIDDKYLEPIDIWCEVNSLEPKASRSSVSH